jgi:hypothetical protein
VGQAVALHDSHGYLLTVPVTELVLDRRQSRFEIGDALVLLGEFISING